MLRLTPPENVLFFLCQLAEQQASIQQSIGVDVNQTDMNTQIMYEFQKLLQDTKVRIGLVDNIVVDCFLLSLSLLIWLLFVVISFLLLMFVFVIIHYYCYLMMLFDVIVCLFVVVVFVVIVVVFCSLECWPNGKFTYCS